MAIGKWAGLDTGSASDCPDAEKIISTLGNEEKARCADVTGKTSLGEAIALMACADKVISMIPGSCILQLH